AAGNNGYTFFGWSGGYCSGSNPVCSITINQSFMATATFDPPAVASLVVSPSVVSPGEGIDVTFSGVSNPTGDDWMALYIAGETFWGNLYNNTWSYSHSPANCNPAGGASASGTCAFTAPYASGDYYFRLFSNGGS